MCVIDLAKKADGTNSEFAGQDKYVPWLVCMDSNGDPVDQCNAQVGLDSADVNNCLKNDAARLVKQYLVSDEGIRGTPTTTVNGKTVDASYSAIKGAICSENSALTGCASSVSV